MNSYRTKENMHKLSFHKTYVHHNSFICGRITRICIQEGYDMTLQPSSVGSSNSSRWHFTADSMHWMVFWHDIQIQTIMPLMIFAPVCGAFFRHYTVLLRSLTRQSHTTTKMAVGVIRSHMIITWTRWRLTDIPFSERGVCRMYGVVGIILLGRETKSTKRGYIN